MISLVLFAHSLISNKQDISNFSLGFSLSTVIAAEFKGHILLFDNGQISSSQVNKDFLLLEEGKEEYA